MSKIVTVVIVAAGCLASVAQEPGVGSNEVVRAIEQATGWTAEELVAALDLMNAKYNRDVKTEAGRKAWFGKLDHTIVNTNDLTRTEVYEEGYTWVEPWAAPKPVEAVKAANAKLKMPVITNGIPARLAAARLRRQAEKETVSNVVERIEVNAPAPEVR